MHPVAAAPLTRIPSQSENWIIEGYFNKVASVSILEGVPFDDISRLFGEHAEELSRNNLPRCYEKSFVKAGTLYVIGHWSVAAGLGVASAALIATPLNILVVPAFFASATGLVAPIAASRTTKEGLDKIHENLESLKETLSPSSLTEIFEIFQKISRGDPDPLSKQVKRIAIATPCNHIFELWEMERYLKKDREKQFDQFRESLIEVDIARVAKRFIAGPSPCPKCKVRFSRDELRIAPEYYRIMHDLYKQKVAQNRYEELGEEIPRREREAKQSTCVIT